MMLARPKRAQRIKKAGHGLHGLLRSPFGGACDFSCCVKPRAGIEYTAHKVTRTQPLVKRAL